MFEIALLVEDELPQLLDVKSKQALSMKCLVVDPKERMARWSKTNNGDENLVGDLHKRCEEKEHRDA